MAIIRWRRDEHARLRNETGPPSPPPRAESGGAGEDFTGILNAGILTEVAGSGPFYAIRAGIA